MHKNKQDKQKDSSKKMDKINPKRDSKNPLIRFLNKLKFYIFEDESPVGWIVAFIVMFLVLKFIFIPLISLSLHTNYPIVAVISGSMEHRLDDSGSVCGYTLPGYKNSFDSWWDTCGPYYSRNYNLTKDQFSKFPQRNGFNIGDVMILYGDKPEKLKVGDVIVFDGGREKPIIHRIVKIKVVDGKYYFSTKGDHNPESYPSFEKDIAQEKVIGKTIFKIPFVGYVKIIAVNILNGFIGIFKN